MGFISSGLAWAEGPPDQPSPPFTSEPCLNCHSLKDLSLTLSSGEALQLYTDAQQFAASVHGQKLVCSDCHSGYTYPHPRQRLESLRDYSLTLYEVCKRCHFANYTKTLDSIHYTMLAQGNPAAPLCVDCHGDHYISPPDRPRARISQTCSSCHKAISETYVASVHGRALVGEDNPDVPVCTDCHGVHNIHDPRTAAFRQRTPELCGGCHSDKALMAKYGVSTNVTQTYLKDFHGATVTLRGQERPDIKSYEAVCTDCHGTHDIQPTDSPLSPVKKGNLVKTCQQCHPDASENFPDAWLSHYEPSPTKAPLLYLVKLFYRFFIPFVVGGLSLHVLLNLWRAAANR